MADEGFYIIKTDAECTDPNLGKLLFDYLDGTLSAECAEAFELHMLNCLACTADIGNSRSLQAAFQCFAQEKAEKRKGLVVIRGTGNRLTIQQAKEKKEDDKK